MLVLDAKCLLFVILVSVISYGKGNRFLVRKGWYRTSHKGPKTSLYNITHLDDNVIKANEYVRISGGITKIPTGGVRNLLVKTLRMTLCGIEEIAPGAFQNLPNLTNLAMNDNEIISVRNGVFNNLNISVLFLQRNAIETIDTEAFDNMPNLYRIKLNSNKIASWDSNWFKNSPRLTELFFRRNFITEIPKTAFRNVKGSHSFKDRTTVDTKIYLSKNKIVKIDPNAFQDFTEFSQLWLDRNEIEQLEEHVFDPLVQVGAIFLSKNQIRGLPENLFPNLGTEILTLDLIGNNNLTCISYAIASKVKTTNLQGVKKINCDCIQQLVKRLASEQKNCDIKSKCRNKMSNQ